MERESYWKTSTTLRSFPSIEGPKTADVVIVGGGITGLMTAYSLQEQGASVIVLEKNRIASGETGRTTAHLTYMTDEPLSKLVSDFGADHAVAVWDAGASAIERIHRVAHEAGIECEFEWVPGFYYGSLEKARDDERSFLEGECELIRTSGFEGRFVEKVELTDRPGVRLERQAQFHPLRFVSGLANVIQSRGPCIFENSEVTEFPEDNRSVIVNGHRIESSSIVFATNVPLQGRRGTVSATMFQTKIYPYTSYVVRAKVDDNRESALYWDTTDPYYYLRISGTEDERYAIFGGADEKTGQESNPEEHFKRVQRTLKTILPEASVTHRWAGQVIESNDGLPFIGELGPNQFIATGYAGNGFTFATVASMIISDHLAGRKNPWSELFDPYRAKIKGGAWDYVKENVDYPYYMAKRFLIGGEKRALESLKPGEGALVSVKGHRVAACRMKDGQLCTVSPVCTHMGCLVNWNRSLQSWDCPCHGSRFSPGGEVIAGPAETALAKVATAD